MDLPLPERRDGGAARRDDCEVTDYGQAGVDAVQVVNQLAGSWHAAS